MHRCLNPSRDQALGCDLQALSTGLSTHSVDNGGGRYFPVVIRFAARCCREFAFPRNAHDKPIHIKHLDTSPQAYQQVFQHKLGITLRDPRCLRPPENAHAAAAVRFRASSANPRAFNALACFSDSFQQAHQHELGISAPNSVRNPRFSSMPLCSLCRLAQKREP